MTQKAFWLPRAFIILTVLMALLGGLASGLARFGWRLDPLSGRWLTAHGPLMISGFLGTLICLERAVALANRSRIGMIAPITNAIGAIALLLWPQETFPRAILTGGSVGLTLLSLWMLRLRPTRDVLVMVGGALCWLGGNLLWLAGWPLYSVVHLWTAFLVLTIIGERLELSRVRRLSRTAEHALMFGVGVYLLGVALTPLALDLGVRVLGGGAMLAAAWLWRYDVAVVTIRQSGLPRYIAACLLAGYAWLAFGGAAALWGGAVYAGPHYALLLHAFLLGFVFSMIFGHAPIILPALTGLNVPFRARFYGPLLLLHSALLYRMYGHWTTDALIERWGGLLNVAAVLLFFGVMAQTVWRARQQTALAPLTGG